MVTRPLREEPSPPASSAGHKVTACNNEGTLTFTYSLEDLDHTESGADVFNGQNSVLWCNLRDSFGREISAMYQQLRSSGMLSYANVETRFEEHQAKWPEAIFNEDAWSKYIGPLINPDEGKESTAVYLPMAQGSKAEQRKWWLYNRFRYMDSKWLAGDARNDVIQLRGYAKADITLTPYTDIYPSIRYGSYTVSERGTHGVPTTLACPIDTLNDTEIYIYSAPQLASVGDLSPLKVGFADFSKATNLQSIVVGSAASGYENRNLTNLNVGSNSLLRTIDARNCPALTGALDFSGATNVEHVYLDGTSATSVLLPVGGILKTLRLPSTVTSLTVRDQRMIETFAVDGDGYGSITTLRVENSSSVIPVLDILDGMPENSRVRIIGFTAFVDETKDVEDFFDYLDTMRGLDEAGNNLEKPVVAGTIAGLGTITGEWLARMNARYPDVTITYQHISSTLRYYSYDGSTLITSETVTDGGNGTYTGTPSRTSTAQYSYSFAGWSLYKDQSTADPNATKRVTADRDVYAAYTATLRTYTVTWKNADGTTLETDTNVPYGSTPHYDGATPTQDGKTATGWNPTPAEVTGDVTYTAAYAPADTIADSWEQIAQHIEAGDYATRYSVGDTKNLDLGSMGIINMQVAGFDVDELSDGSGKAAISWVSEQLLNTQRRMNPALVTNYLYEDGPSFARAQSSTSYTDYNKWVPQNSYIKDEVARITIAATAKLGGATLRIRYVTGYDTNASLKINGTEIITKESNSFQQYDMSLVEGTQYVFVYEITCPTDNTSTFGDYFALYDSNYSGSQSSMDRILTFDSIEIEDCTIRKFMGNESGTGGIGGWEQSEMRSYIDESVKTLIPSNVEKEMVEVAKHSRSCDTSGNAIQITTSDRLWIPSYREVLCNSNFDTAGAMYGRLFVDKASRKKTTVGSTVFAKWWLRTASDASRFISVNNSGEYGSQVATTESLVAFGFCTGRSPKQFGEITDSWDEIIANVNNGTAASKYGVGAYKPLDLGSEGVINMQIAAVNSDELADGSGTATLSFVGKELLKTMHRLNPPLATDPDDSTKYQEGTGMVGGWEKCELRTYLADTILPLIPSNVAAAMKAVKKYSNGWSTSNAKVANMETSDTIWIPSIYEIAGASGTIYETSGLTYTDLFGSTENRKKAVVGQTSFTSWWLRSANSGAYGYEVNNSGSFPSDPAYNMHGICLGFCL